MSAKLVRLLAVCSTVLTFAACGGSGGGAAPPPPPPPPPPVSGWVQGKFDPYLNFFARCEMPRNGNHPETGRPWPDIQGTTLDENNFLRSYSDDTYLWYSEIPDQDPGLFSDPRVYFEELKTFETLPSGSPKDAPGFHYSMTTEEFFNEYQSGITFGYGARFAILSPTPPREVVVVFTEPGTPAEMAGITRGALVVGVDGFDINTNTQAGVDALNAAIFPQTDGETHTFSVLDLGAQNPRDVVLAAGLIERAFVQNVDVLDTPTGRIGYMTFNAFRGPSEEQLIDAINQLNQGQGVDDLVLDLRYNGGGINDIAGQLGYMIAGPARTAGKVFDLVRFNDKYPDTDPVTGQPITPTPFFDVTQGFDALPPGNPLPTLDLPRVFILSGSGTCSASESVINGLRGIDVEVILIGSTTCGKPYGFYPTDNCGNTYFTIQLKGTNAKGYGDFVDGFQPSAADDGEAQVAGCVVADDFTALLGDPAENKLEVALAYRDGMGCITPSAGTQGGLSKPGIRMDAAEPILLRSPIESFRIERRP